MMILFLIGAQLIMGVMGEIEFTHDMLLHPDYHMWWKFDDEEITVKVQVKTTGWVGWGLSQNGMMRGADMVIGWLDSERKEHFHDRHAGGNYQPSIDDHQDYDLLQMTETNGSTSFTFKRKLQLSDEQDITITGDTMRILWSWNDGADPTGNNDIQKHTKHGARSAYLLDYGDIRKQPLPKQYKTFNVTMTNFTIPPHETTYWCKIVKMPDMGTKKQHMIQVDAIITPGNEAFVHHMILYQCMDVPDDKLNVENNCKVQNMPGVQCTDITVTGWAIGGGPLYYPPHAGLSLNSLGDPKFLLLEIHYDNPNRINDAVDSSGMRLYYTEELRKFDAAVIAAGLWPRIKYSQIIPQQQKSFTSFGFCPSKCIDSDAGNEKPKIFAALLHAHVHGIKIIVRLIDETTGKEVKTIAQDLNYDFNYQEVRYLKEPIEILPGHRIDVECTLNTMDRQIPLLNGLGTQEEMCLAYLSVYPKLNTKSCISYSMNPWTWGAYNLDWKVKPSEGYLMSPVVVGNTSYGIGRPAYEPLLNEEFWRNDEARVKSFEKAGEEQMYVYYCSFANGTHNGGRALMQNKPRILLRRDGSGVMKNSMSIFQLLLLFCMVTYMNY